MRVPGGAVGAVNGRVLDWEGCVNVRDLGHLPSTRTGSTRAGAVVRADNVRRLTERGWERARRFGVRRVVDLRFPGEDPGEPPLDAGVEVVSVSLFGERDPAEEERFERALRGSAETGRSFAGLYVHTLERRSDRVAEAVTAVGDADGPVVVHCAAGKDRTGLVAALLLSLAGVPDDEVAADYALSGPNVEVLFREWVDAAAHDAVEHRLRMRLLESPMSAMTATLSRLRELGGAETYLLEAGVDAVTLRRLRARL